MVFIWVENSLWNKVIEMFDNWNYKYVDSLCWVKKNDNNHFFAAKVDDVKYFKGQNNIMIDVSVSLLIFRKLDEVRVYSKNMLGIQ
jgi:N6-adenosine-specific RNA methylase IME4